jgi:hypothetical protein
MVAFATLTCSVHFVSLTAGRQVESSVFPQLWRQVSFMSGRLWRLPWSFSLGIFSLGWQCYSRHLFGSRLEPTFESAC